MLINIHHDSPAEHRKLLLCGVLFIAMIAAFLTISVAFYQKVFEPVTMVTIKADRAGLQLAKFGDVRLNGALVGQVRSVEQDGDEASIKLGLRPDAAKTIPENISVQILPTTLFGQKFVALVRPEAPSGRLSDGQVIPSNRVETNVELNRILSELFPLLRSIRPADLSRALTSLANALEGKGNVLGVTMEKVEGYLSVIEGELPQLREDMVLLADVAQTYADAAPDLLATLGNLTVTANTLVDQKESLAAFLNDLTGLSQTSTRVLEANERNLIRATELTEPITDLLAVYSPEFPCLFRGLAKYDDYLNDMFAGNRVKQYTELGATQMEGYKEEDRPVYGEIGRGPLCHGLPNPEFPIGKFEIRNGDNGSIDKTNPFSILSGDSFLRTSNQYAGTEAEQYAVNSLLAARSGRPVDEYSATSAIVYGPLVKGEEVTQ
ncbi:MCE family protein [Nocardioides alcanivorans]|uniref:MCE family protein n=1 Tax=Nocardioides alcanivorans TaxID=2897352 RepID=UPI001F1AFDF6|nr:MCE family protein [Nocardioides alcanivorans]